LESMPTQGKPSRLSLGPFGPEHAFTTPKASRSRITQERLSKTERETDNHRLNQRQKQIDFGKNTPGYLNYVSEVPIDTRSKADPWTPDIHKKYPKRVWDVIVRTWRRQLHKYDLDASSTLFIDSEPSSPSSSPSLNISMNSEDDPIDYINDAIQKFQQEDETEGQYDDAPFLPSSTSMGNFGYAFNSGLQTPQFVPNDSRSQVTPYASSTPFSFSTLGEDSNSSMDSTTTSTHSFFSDSNTVDYMSENSSDSWASIPLTPISLLGSPFASRTPSFGSTTSSQTLSVPLESNLTSTTSYSAPRVARSASQHYSASSAHTQGFSTPTTNALAFSAHQSSNSASLHSSPYGAIGAIPRFSLAAASSTTNHFVPKLPTQDENTENSTLWNSH